MMLGNDQDSNAGHALECAGRDGMLGVRPYVCGRSARDCIYDCHPNRDSAQRSRSVLVVLHATYRCCRISPGLVFQTDCLLRAVN